MPSDSPRNVVIHGHVLDALRSIPDGSVQACVSSPPYWGLRAYGTEPQLWGGEWRGDLGMEPVHDCAAWARGEPPCPGCYTCHLRSVFAEVRRVLRPDGLCYLNLGDSYTSGDRTYRDPGSTPLHGAHGSQDGLARPRTPVGLKPKDLCGVPWRAALALQADGFYLRNDNVWCVGGGVEIYVQTVNNAVGPMMVKDVAKLKPETVRLWTGDRWTRVLGWSSVEEDDAIEFVLRSGERITCTRHHLWPTMRGEVAARDLVVSDILITTRLPEPNESLRPSGLDDETVGWFVGAYLANGSMSGETVQIACREDHEERYKRIKRFADSFHASCVRHFTTGRSATINLNGPLPKAIMNTYISGRTAHDKHLSWRCWERTDAFLRAVLDGYLEGDCHWDAKNQMWRLGFCRNYHLETSLRTLCARLGFFLRLNLSTAKIGAKAYPSFKGQLRFYRSPHHNSKQDAEIVAIRKAKGRQFWHVGVEDESHRFALASGVLSLNSKRNCIPSSVQDRCTMSHEYVFMFSKQERYFYDAFAVREDAETDAAGNKERFVADGTRGRPADHMGSSIPWVNDGGGRNRRTVWTMPTQPMTIECCSLCGATYDGPEMAGLPAAGDAKVCRCGRSDGWTSHFASFPEELASICVLASTSEKGCCANCGAPWARVVERAAMPRPEPPRRNEADGGLTNGQRFDRTGVTHREVADWIAANPPKTTGWEPGCSCNGSLARSLVLDPFMGSGTTALVALKAGRDFLGIELNADFIRIAERRIAAELAQARLF